LIDYAYIVCTIQGMEIESDPDPDPIKAASNLIKQGTT
jgi:hypothetical protein